MFLFHAVARFIGIVLLGLILAGGAPVYAERFDAKASRDADVPILLYHHIADLPVTASAAQRRWTISPKKFESQIEWVLAQGFHPVTMAQLIAHLKHGESLPAKPIVLSFDDGWKDQYAGAFPVLKKHNIRATFFIITDSVGHSAYMQWEQIREMSSAGMDIQPHSNTHLRLSVLAREKARSEIVTSKKMLESHLNKPALIFAYPFGSYADEVISLVKEAGIEAAVTISGLNGGYLFRKDQSFTLNRYAVEASDRLENLPRLRASNKLLPCALFVSLIQDPPVLTGKEAIAELIDFAKRARVTALFVQVYRENKAWFPSRVADASPYKKCVKDAGEDPFALLIREAHREGIEVHAWLNLLSLADNANAVFIKKYGAEILTRNAHKKKQLPDYKIDAQYFLEPGDLRVKRDLLKIVAELLRSYPGLDGIQYDYIRYPDMEPHYGYTKNNMQRFKKATGQKTIDEESSIWKDWRRRQVTELLETLSAKARSLRPNIQVSATGCMPYSRAYLEAYQDWPSWIANRSVDFVTIMNYSPEPEEFRHWIGGAKNKTQDFFKVKIGVGAYKLVNKPGIFAEELRECRRIKSPCAIFHYGSLLENPALKEVLINALNEEEF